MENQRVYKIACYAMPVNNVKVMLCIFYGERVTFQPEFAHKNTNNMGFL